MPRHFLVSYVWIRPYNRYFLSCHLHHNLTFQPLHEADRSPIILLYRRLVIFSVQMFRVSHISACINRHGWETDTCNSWFGIRTMCDYRWNHLCRLLRRTSGFANFIFVILPLLTHSSNVINMHNQIIPLDFLVSVRVSPNIYVRPAMLSSFGRLFYRRMNGKFL